MIQHADGCRRLQGNLHVSGQPVAAAAGDDAHCLAKALQTRHDVVHTAVASHRHYRVVAACFGRTAGKLSSMVRPLRVAHREIECRVVEVFLDYVFYLLLFAYAGMRIYHKQQVAFCIHECVSECWE